MQRQASHTNITAERRAWGHLVDDARLAASLDSHGLLENGPGLLDIGGDGSGGGTVLLGDLLAEIDAVVSLVPEGGGVRAEGRR